MKLQKLCDSLGPEEIDRVFRKWLRRITLPLRQSLHLPLGQWFEETLDLAHTADSDDVYQSFRSHADQIGAKRRRALSV